MNLKGHLARIRKTMPQLNAELAKKVIAVEAAAFHDENFKNQSWEGASWKAREDGDTSRGLLVGLRNADNNDKTEKRLRDGATAGVTRNNIVDFIMPIYGEVHNEGLKAGRGSGFIMPKRQFAGQSKVLKSRFKKKAIQLITKRLSKS